MIYSIIFNFKYIFTKKVKIIIFVSFTLLGLFQVARLNCITSTYEVNKNLFDFILFTLGGKESPTTFSFILNWIFIIFIFIYVSVTSSNSINKLALLSLNRVNSRLKFWIITCSNQLLLTMISFMISFIIIFIVGLISFGLDLNYSEYTKLFYENWYSHNFISIIILISIIFISGIYAIQMIIQVSLLLSDNKVNLFIGYLAISIITGMLYIYNKIPRFLAPLFYPSTLSLNLSSIRNALLLNLSIAIIGIIIGYLVFMNKDVK